MNRADVLVYVGDGVGANLLRHVIPALQRWLGHKYDVKRVDAQALADQPWQDHTALLVVPGGRDTPYARDLNGKANRKIRQYVENGGSYLGICAGAYYACRKVEFELGSPLLQVDAPRELALFPGVGRGCVYRGFAYDSEAGARATRVTVNTTHMVDLAAASVSVYYNGGCTFDQPNQQQQQQHQQHQTLAWYPNDEEGKGQPAMIECRVGKGVAVMSGVHLEYDTRLANPASDLPAVVQGLEADDQARALLMRSTLRRLGLKTSDVALTDPAMTDLALIVQGLTPTSPSCERVWATLKAGGDTLVTGDESFQIRVDGSKADRTQQQVHVQRLKAIPTESLQTSFDSTLYFEHHKQVADSLDSFGSSLLYAEVTTSTQTILDKNPKLLQSLDDGFVCVAARQVAGRGRGGNSWISSSGCLQFSFALKHRKAETVVFIQYLVALAAAEAVRSKPGYKDVEIAIKWPNDIYSVEPAAATGSSSPTLRKIGGVLVNSTYLGGTFHLVVGCGVNVNNSEPTDCINDVISRYNARTGATLNLIRKEEMLARTMANFENLLALMNEQNSFKPLLPLYYRYWLHSGEKVRLEDFGGVEAVIEGINEHGFLVTRGVANPSDVFEHQPDGNSFDLMKHMIVKKK